MAERPGRSRGIRTGSPSRPGAAGAQCEAVSGDTSHGIVGLPSGTRCCACSRSRHTRVCLDRRAQASPHPARLRARPSLRFGSDGSCFARGLSTADLAPVRSLVSREPGLHGAQPQFSSRKRPSRAGVQDVVRASLWLSNRARTQWAMTGSTPCRTQQHLQGAGYRQQSESAFALITSCLRHARAAATGCPIPSLPFKRRALSQ